MNPAAGVDTVLYPMRCYPDKNRLSNDAKALLNIYRELHANAAPGPAGPQPLFNMAGTIPVVIKAVKYNIPVRIWIPIEYPYRPPMVFVTPTPGMAIPPNHPNVNAQGAVYMPYLQTWNPATHSLLPLVQAMTQIFSQRTPVQSVQSYSAPQQPPQSYPGYGQPPSGYHQHTQSAGYQQPPYPGQQPHHQQQSSYSPYSQPPSSTPSSSGPYPQPQPQQDQRRHRPPPPETPMDKKRRELRDMCRAKIREMTQEDLTAKTDRLEKEKREKENALNNSMSQMQQMKKEVEELNLKIKDLDEFLAKNSGEMDVDKVTDPADIHRLQLIHSVAKDMAIEDILYHFDRALLKGVINLDEYLKLCRQYSNDQFYERALTRRIREILSAPPSR